MTDGGAGRTGATAGSGVAGAEAGGGGAAGAGAGAGGAAGAGARGDDGNAGGCASGPVGTLSGPLSSGITLVDTDGARVNAHGGGIIRVGDTFYMHGMSFSSGTSDNAFIGFTMYSSRDLATWKNEGVILPRQPVSPTGLLKMPAL